MKQVIIKVYRTIYHVTGAKKISYMLALGYVTTLNLVTIYGLCLLLEDLYPIQFVNYLFAFPYLLLTSAGMLAVNIKIMPPMQNIDVVKKTKPSRDLIIYTIINLLLFIYIIAEKGVV